MKIHVSFRRQLSMLGMIGALLLMGAIVGCTSIAPKPKQLQLPTEPPKLRETSFSTALTQLGMQSVIYGDKLLKIQCRDIEDVTGTSYFTGGEIPKSITIMVKSALNAIGGRVVYIPFWPDYVTGIQVSGYPVSKQKAVPDVILSGGITEFDRGLETVDRTRNFDAETGDILNGPEIFDNKTIGLDYAKKDTWNKANIAIDFNLVSYKAMCGIPRMQASNGVTVYKGIKEEELGFTLFGPTIGLRGSVKKIQGRHDAVRLLVQFSVIQLVGRFLDLPYWRLVDGLDPDPVVMEAVTTGYRQKNHTTQTLVLKRLLWLHGYSVAVDDQLDDETKAALAKVDETFDSQSISVPVETFLNLYLSVPLTPKSMEQANLFDRLLADIMAPKELPQKQPALEDMRTPTPSPQPQTQTQTMTQGQPQPQIQAAENKRIEEPKKAVAEEKRTATKAAEETSPEAEVTHVEDSIERLSSRTPLDIKTDYSLRRIIQRISDKRDTQSNETDQPYQSVSIEH